MMRGALPSLRALWAGAIPAAGLLLLLGCASGKRSSGDRHGWPRFAATEQARAPRSSARHVVVGLMPCAIYSIDINGRRASFARATAEGRGTFTAALEPNDRVEMKLYRRMPCPY